MEPNRGSVRDRPADAVAQDYPQRTDAPVSYGRFTGLIDLLLLSPPLGKDKYPPQPRQSFCGYGSYHPENPYAMDRLASILCDLAESYEAEKKYTGNMFEFFIPKFRMFSHLCCMYRVPEDALRRAFPTMLAGQALLYYLRALARTSMTFDEIVLAIHAHFEPQSTRDIYMLRFQDLMLRNIIVCNPDLTKEECFNQLIEKLEAIHDGLYHPSTRDTILRIRLLHAIKDVPECDLAFFFRADTYSGLVGDIIKCLNM